MKKLNKNLSEIFDVEPIKEETKVEQLPVILESIDPVEADTDFARENIRNLIDTGNKAVVDLASVANQSEAPRAYEVLATMMKNLSDMNKDLLEIQKRKQDLKPKVSNNTQNINVDKAVFVGSTAELLKQLKENK